MAAGIKADSPWSKLVVVKMKGMKDRDQDSLSPFITHVPQEDVWLFLTRWWHMDKHCCCMVTEGLFRAAAS